MLNKKKKTQNTSNTDHRAGGRLSEMVAATDSGDVLLDACGVQGDAAGTADIVLLAKFFFVAQ